MADCRSQFIEYLLNIISSKQTRGLSFCISSSRLGSYCRPCWTENYWVTPRGRTEKPTVVLAQAVLLFVKNRPYFCEQYSQSDMRATVVVFLFCNNLQSRQCGLCSLCFSFLPLSTISLLPVKTSFWSSSFSQHFLSKQLLRVFNEAMWTTSII